MRSERHEATITSSLKPEVVAERAHAVCLSVRQIVRAMTDTLEFVGGQMRRGGSEPGEHFDGAVSLLRDALSGSASASDFAGDTGSRAADVTSGVWLWVGESDLDPGARLRWSAHAVSVAVWLTSSYLRMGDYPPKIDIREFLASCSLAASVAFPRGDAYEAQGPVVSVFVRAAGEVVPARARSDFGGTLARLAAAGQFGMVACEADEAVRVRLVRMGLAERAEGRIVATGKGVRRARSL